MKPQFFLRLMFLTLSIFCAAANRTHLADVATQDSNNEIASVAKYHKLPEIPKLVRISRVDSFSESGKYSKNKCINCTYNQEHADAAFLFCDTDMHFHNLDIEPMHRKRSFAERRRIFWNTIKRIIRQLLLLCFSIF